MLHHLQAFGREPGLPLDPAEAGRPEGAKLAEAIRMVPDHPADQVKGYPCRATPVSLLVGSAVDRTRVRRRLLPAARNVAIGISQAAAGV